MSISASLTLCTIVCSSPFVKSNEEHKSGTEFAYNSNASQTVSSNSLCLLPYRLFASPASASSVDMFVPFDLEM